MDLELMAMGIWLINIAYILHMQKKARVMLSELNTSLFEVTRLRVQYENTLKTVPAWREFFTKQTGNIVS